MTTTKYPRHGQADIHCFMSIRTKVALAKTLHQTAKSPTASASIMKSNTVGSKKLSCSLSYARNY
jgi:hypothetical protein